MVGVALLQKTRAEQTKVCEGDGLVFAQYCRSGRLYALLEDVQVSVSVSVSARLTRLLSGPQSSMLGHDLVGSCVGWERSDIHIRVSVRRRRQVRETSKPVELCLLVWPDKKECGMVSQWRFQSAVSSLGRSCRVSKDA